MASFEMLIGLPAAGKTTYAKSKEMDGFVRVSSDDVRHELFGGGGFTKEEQAQVFKEVNKRIVDELNHGKNVIMDATNMSRKRRKETLERLPINTRKITARLFISPLDRLMKRNAERGNSVPEETYDRMIRCFDPPSITLERFDEVALAFDDEPYNMFPYNDLDVLKAIPHDTDYHAETIGSHMLLAGEIGKTFNPQIHYAALYHDIGKPFVKSFKDRKGKQLDHAVYYNHENVGAYLWLLLWNNTPDHFGLDYRDAMYVSLLISFHMRPFILDRSSRAFINDSKMFRSVSWYLRDILILHQIDISATTEVKNVK